MTELQRQLNAELQRQKAVKKVKEMQQVQEEISLLTGEDLMRGFLLGCIAFGVIQLLYGFGILH